MGFFSRYLPILICVSVSSAAAETVSFNRDIRPILSENCFACHGFDKSTRKGKLRLDVRDESAAEVLVRDAEGMSELVARIVTDDPDDHMPPAKTKKELTAAQVELLRKWVAQGAKYESHWAWIPPQKAEIPRAAKGREIDHFVAARLKSEGFGPAARARANRLVRRLHLDLVGLPPSAAEAQVLVATNDFESAYERVVDSLLASPHFGEKWAIMWLDLARYADTVGYHGDQPVSVSPYRDYVIRAFNSNKRYDVFTREQLAGDLFPNATDEQRVASGFNRLNMTTEEGGSQPKEYLAKYAADRVRTTSTVFMGATLGCAECHDHKFDPYTTKDFYSFAAFFADVEEVGVYSNRGRPPEMLVRPPEALEALGVAQKELAQAQVELVKAGEEIGAGLSGWAARIVKELADNKSHDFVWLEDAVPAATHVTGAWKAVGGDVASGTQAWRQEAPENAGVQQYFREAKKPVTLSAGDHFYFHVKLDPAKPPQEIMLQVHSKPHGGWEHRAFWGADKIAYGGIGRDKAFHRPMGALPETGRWVRLEVPIERLGFKAGQKVDGFSFDQFGGVALWDQAGVRTTGGSAETKALPAPVLAALKKPASERDEAQRKVIADHYRSIAPETKPQRDRVAALKKKVEDLGKQGTKTLVTVSKKPRMMRILPRGNWLDDSGEVVEPAVPGFLAQAVGVRKPAGGRLTRLDLADWLVAPENPLTARVFVNRVWKQLFGTGISKVLDDVGSQGEWPVHPELLDWLAVDFVESGWDIKRLIKNIVMSETYRQSSMPRKDLMERDPYNRLLARQSSFRLDAELVRDQFLAVSGQLVREFGGPSVYPYQPAGLYRHLNFPRRTYKASTDQEPVAPRCLHPLAAHVPAPDAQGLRRPEPRRVRCRPAAVEHARAGARPAQRPEPGRVRARLRRPHRERGRMAISLQAPRLGVPRGAQPPTVRGRGRDPEAAVRRPPTRNSKQPTESRRRVPQRRTLGGSQFARQGRPRRMDVRRARHLQPPRNHDHPLH